MLPVGSAKTTKSNVLVYFPGKRNSKVEMSLFPSKNDKNALTKPLKHHLINDALPRSLRKNG